MAFLAVSRAQDILKDVLTLKRQTTGANDPQNGVPTFFPPKIPAKQKEIRAEPEKEAYPTKNGPSNAEK
jgi:hypothetical protein